MMKRRSFLQKVTLGIGVLGFSSLPFAMSRLLFPKVNATVTNRVPLPGALPNPGDFIQACRLWFMWRSLSAKMYFVS